MAKKTKAIKNKYWFVRGGESGTIEVYSEEPHWSVKKHKWAVVAYEAALIDQVPIANFVAKHGWEPAADSCYEIKVVWT